jgi:hypothetical protein
MDYNKHEPVVNNLKLLLSTSLWNMERQDEGNDAELVVA